MSSLQAAAGLGHSQSNLSSSTPTVTRWPRPKCRIGHEANEGTMTTNHRMQNLTEDTRTATGIAAKAVIAPREWTTEPGWVRPDNRTPKGVEEQTCGEPGTRWLA